MNEPVCEQVNGLLPSTGMPAVLSPEPSLSPSCFLLHPLQQDLLLTQRPMGWRLALLQGHLGRQTHCQGHRSSLSGCQKHFLPLFSSTYVPLGLCPVAFWDREASGAPCLLQGPGQPASVSQMPKPPSALIQALSSFLKIIPTVSLEISLTQKKRNWEERMKQWEKLSPVLCAPTVCWPGLHTLSELGALPPGWWNKPCGPAVHVSISRHLNRIQDLQCPKAEMCLARTS